MLPPPPPSHFKIIAFLLLAVILTIGGCKKSDKDTNTPPPLSALEKAQLKEIKDKEALFTEQSIPATTAAGQILKNGAIIFYKTNSGNYGKLQVINIAEKNADSYLSDLLTIDVITYKSDESTVLANKKKLTIKGVFSCDLDKGIETDVSADFRWGRADITHMYFAPLNGATFYTYSN